MGNGNVKDFNLSSEEIESYVNSTSFCASEIVLLHCQYVKICHEHKGNHLIGRQEFQKSLGFSLHESWFIDQVFQQIDDKSHETLSFSDFLKGLSILSSKSSLQEKINFSFKVYDLDKDNKISKEELTKILLLTTSENCIVLNEAQIEQVIQRTFDEVDRDKDGFISFEEYQSFIHKNKQLVNHLNIKLAGLGENKSNIRFSLLSYSDDCLTDPNIAIS